MDKLDNDDVLTANFIPTSRCPDQFLEFHAPQGALFEVFHKRVELWRHSGSNLAQGGHGTQGAPLQLRRALEILLDRVLCDRGTLHRLLELRCRLIQTLGDGCRSDLREPEQHHMRDHLDLVRRVRETRDNAAQELVQVQLVQTGIQLRA